MTILSKDNRDLAEIEAELRARVDAQRQALETLRAENARLKEEVALLREVLNADLQGFHIGEPQPVTAVAAKA
jgi:cell division protein FtsB